MSLLIDVLATCSLVGIWPRYIEPRRLKMTELTWDLDPDEAHLDGLKIVHLTDLHFHRKTSKRFLEKILSRIEKIQPDLILFTGDFLCYSRLECPEQFASFLACFRAPLGCYCSFGNHDYAQYVSLTKEGVYDIVKPPKPLAGIYRGLQALFSKAKMGTRLSENVRLISLHKNLCDLLSTTAFKILENKTVTLPIGLNLSGLGDLGLGRCHPSVAFAEYDPKFPGIVLSHNPDSLPSLLPFPGKWILCGHTHGEQIHLPWPKWGRALSQKLARLQNCLYTRGLFQIGDKKLYVNRGLGGHKPFRLFSPPEICIIRAIKS